MGKQIPDDDMASKRQRIERSLVDDAIAEEMQQCVKIGGSWYEQTINDDGGPPLPKDSTPRAYSPATYEGAPAQAPAQTPVWASDVEMKEDQQPWKPPPFLDDKLRPGHPELTSPRVWTDESVKQQIRQMFTAPIVVTYNVKEDKVKDKEEDKEVDKESPVEPANVEDREPVYQHKEVDIPLEVVFE